MPEADYEFRRSSQKWVEIGSLAQLSYLHVISDLSDFRKAHEASADALRNFWISEVLYLTVERSL